MLILLFEWFKSVSIVKCVQSVVHIDLLVWFVPRLRDFFQFFFSFCRSGVFLFFLCSKSSIHHNRPMNTSCLSTFAFFSLTLLTPNRMFCCQCAIARAFSLILTNGFYTNENNNRVNDIMETAKKLNTLNDFCFYDAESDAITTHHFYGLLWLSEFIFFSFFFFCFSGYIVNSYAYSYYAVSVEIWTFLVFGIQWNSYHLTRPIHFRTVFVPLTNGAASKVAATSFTNETVYNQVAKKLPSNQFRNEMLMIEQKGKITTTGYWSKKVNWKD